MKLKKYPLLVILGPTSTGKTDLALSLAKRFDGEIISCDSRQVYINLDLGTGKLPSQQKTLKKGKGFWEIDGVKVWLYDVVSAKLQYSVADYIKDAHKVLKDLRERGKLPIIVGGTGLYLKGLVEGLSNIDIPIDKELRKSLEKLSKEELQKKLINLSLKKWNQMNNSDRQNPRRLVRAIELILLSPRVEKQINSKSFLQQNYHTFKVGLTASKEMLYKRVDDSVVKRIKQGMVKETKELNLKGLTFQRMRQLGLEYGVLADYLEDKIKTQDQLIKTMQAKIHDFIRRQLTWFKKGKDIYWFDISDKGYDKKIENTVFKWYDSHINDTKD